MYVISHMWILLNLWQMGLYSSKALLQLQNYKRCDPVGAGTLKVVAEFLLRVV